MIFEGNCWKFGHNIPTDEITPTSVVWKSFPEMAKHVFESLNPEFPQKVQKGDIVIAGRNFGCSSGRAIAAKAIRATGVAAVVAEGSRNVTATAHEVGFILELPAFMISCKTATESAWISRMARHEPHLGNLERPPASRFSRCQRRRPHLFLEDKPAFNSMSEANASP